MGELKKLLENAGITEKFDQVECRITFNKPVAVQAVNMLNSIYRKEGAGADAYMGDDKHTVNVDVDNGVFGGILVDITDHVIDELGGGTYDNLDPIKEDDYWGDRPDPQGDRDRAEERKGAMIELLKGYVDWEDRLDWHRDEIEYSTPRPKGQIGTKVPGGHPEANKAMKEDMREMGNTMIAELRTAFDVDFEIVSLGPYSVALREIEGMNEDSAEEEEWISSMGWDQDDEDEMLGDRSFQAPNGDIWDSEEEYNDFMSVKKNAGI